MCVHMIRVNICYVVGDTALHAAVKHGYIDIVRLLLHHNAEICACSVHKLTPVFIAAQFGKADCLKLLLAEALAQGKLITVVLTHLPLSMLGTS